MQLVCKIADHLLTPYFQNELISIVLNDPKLRSIKVLLTKSAPDDQDDQCKNFLFKIMCLSILTAVEIV
jgi:hypothetical protein